MIIQKTKIAILLSLLLIVVIAGYLWQASWPAPKAGLPPGPLEKISIAAVQSTTASLLVIAREKGYFRDNGLEVALKFFPTGPLGLDQVKSGQIDVAHIADFVLVGEIFRGEQRLRCLGSIAAADVNLLLARKDKGILQPGDLAGKTIGVPRGTQAEFFLGRFLTFHYLRLSDVQISYLNPPDMVAAMAQERVDAVMVWEPYSYDIMRQLGENIINWRGQSNQKFYNILVSTDEFSKARSGSLERLFQALAQGETFIKNNREESMAIVAKWLNLDRAVFETDWRNSEYELSFDQSLLISMEDEARWMIQNKLVQQTKVPDYLNYFEVEPLARAAPMAVQVFIPKGKGIGVPGSTVMEQEIK